MFSVPHECEAPGLYLFPDGGQPVIALTAERVKHFAHDLWLDPDRLPPATRAAAEFQRCDICPALSLGGLCDAIRPTLTTFGAVDRYASYDRVIAVYRAEGSGILGVAETDMQGALKYVAMLSLLYFCQCGRKYWPYFRGVTPLMGPSEIAEFLYLNMFWIHRGDRQAMQEMIRRFKDEMFLTSRNQNLRLNLLCTNDALMNAFVGTFVIAEFLSRGIEQRLADSFSRFEEA
jgi:hypothetical protein